MICRCLWSETVEPKFRKPAGAGTLGPYAKKPSAWLKSKTSRPRKQKPTARQLHADSVCLDFGGFYNRVGAFACVWKEKVLMRPVRG